MVMFTAKLRLLTPVQGKFYNTLAVSIPLALLSGKISVLKIVRLSLSLNTVTHFQLRQTHPWKRNSNGRLCCMIWTTRTGIKHRPLSSLPFLSSDDLLTLPILDGSISKAEMIEVIDSVFSLVRGSGKDSHLDIYVEKSRFTKPNFRRFSWFVT